MKLKTLQSLLKTKKSLANPVPVTCIEKSFSSKLKIAYFLYFNKYFELLFIEGVGISEFNMQFKLFNLKTNPLVKSIPINFRLEM